MENLELVVKNYNEVQKIEFNYEDLKNKLESILDNYKGIKYTEQTLSLAKEDRATINKIVKAIDDKRKEIKNKYLAPFNEFESKVKELINIAKSTSQEIDTQVKEFEEAQRKEKFKVTQELINEINVNNYPVNLFEERYLLKSVSANEIKNSVELKLNRIDEDLKIIDSLTPVAKDLIVKYYFDSNLDLSSTIQEINKQKELMQKVEPVKEEKVIIEKADVGEHLNEYNLTIFATEKQYNSLKRFLAENSIKCI